MVCVVFIETRTKKIANGKKSVVSLKMRDNFRFSSVVVNHVQSVKTIWNL